MPAFAAQRRAAATCCGAVAAGRTPLSIDISFPPARRSAANPPHAAAAAVE